MQSTGYSPAIPGLQYGIDSYRNFTGIAEGDIGFGLAVTKGAAILNNQRRGVKVAADATFLGVAVRDRTRYQSKYEATDAVNVLTQGKIWVKTSAAVTAANPVFYRTNAGFEGQFCGAADGTNTQPVTSARFLGNYPAGLACIEFSAPIAP